MPIEYSEHPGQPVRYRPASARPDAQEAVDDLMVPQGQTLLLASLSSVALSAVNALIECRWVMQTFVELSRTGRMPEVVSIDSEDGAAQNVLDHAASLLNEACFALGHVRDVGARHDHVEDPLWGLELDTSIWRAKSTLAMIISIVGREDEAVYWPRVETGLLSLICSIDGFISEGKDVATVLDALTDAAVRSDAVGDAQSVSRRASDAAPKGTS